MGKALFRSLRTTIVLLAVLAVALLALTVLERSVATPGGAVTNPAIELSNHKQQAPPEKTAKEKDPKPPKDHCTDGKGKDGVKNPNCTISRG